MADEKDNKIDKTLLNDPILLLQKCFNTGEAKFAQDAIDKLSLLLQQQGSPEQIVPVRMDKLIIPEGKGFISTGVKWADDSLGGGARKQELVIVGGSPHAGKTHMITYLSACFIKQKLKGLHFNGEDLIGDVYDIYGNMLEEEHKEQLFMVDIVDTFSIALVDESIKACPEKPDFVVIDHIDAMTSAGTEQDWQEVGKIVSALRLLAKKHNCFILTASQLNFASPGNSGMSRFHRGKVGKAGPADVVWIIDDQIDGEFFMSVSKAKGRRVQNKKFSIKFNLNTMELI